MIIADHCMPGNYRNDGHSPVCSWPADCYVQWGSNGIVFTKDTTADSYNTAFFEAFPSDPKTFIRGEGKTITEAEQNAFGQYQRFTACVGHEFERRNYTNGAGFCKHCGLFKSKVFEPLPTDPNKKSNLEKLFNLLSPEGHGLSPEETAVAQEVLKKTVEHVVDELAKPR